MALESPLSEGLGHTKGRSGPTLEDFHARYSHWLSQQLRRRFGPDISDDIAQDTWLKIATLSTVSAIRYPKAFLLRVAINAALSERRRMEVSKRNLPSLPSGTPVDADQLERVFLREVVLGLPQPLRDVFVLSRFGGLTNSQIGEQLGISPKTVEWRMTKALAHCAAQFRR